MSDFTVIIVSFLIVIGAMGIGGLLWGLRTMRRTPRDQPALDRWLKRMRTDGAQHIPQHLTGDQFDRETLVALARYQGRIQGTLMIGIGSGMLIGLSGSTALLWFLDVLYPNLTDQPSVFFLLLAPLSLGVILGSGVSALLDAVLSNRSLVAMATTPERRIRTYRAHWFLWVNCLAFLFCATVAALIGANVLPGSVVTNTSTVERTPLELLLLAPGLVGAIILLAETVSRLILRFPLRVTGLPPAVAIQVEESLLSRSIGQVWGVTSILGITCACFSEAFLLPLSRIGTFHVGTLLTAILFYVGMTYMFVGTGYLFLQLTVRPAPMTTAIALAAKPQENTLNG